jgi:hypothetical protein
MCHFNLEGIEIFVGYINYFPTLDYFDCEQIENSFGTPKSNSVSSYKQLRLQCCSYMHYFRGNKRFNYTSISF